MENATKAILMAGGILVSIIVLAIFIFAFNNISNFMDSAEKNPNEEELADFNSGFEAYQKSLMYGIDIISVLNQAVDNNRSYGVEYYNNPDEVDNLEYYVDVVFSYHTSKVEEADVDEVVTYSLMNNYTKNNNIIKDKFLDPVKDPNKNTAGRDDPNYSKYEFIHNFNVTDFKCRKIDYNQKNDVKSLGALRKS